MALGAIGREEQTDHIVREHKRFRLMTTTMSHQHNSACLLLGGCERMQKDLKVCRIQVGQLQQKAFTRCGFDGSIDREVLELLVH